MSDVTKTGITLTFGPNAKREFDRVHEELHAPCGCAFHERPAPHWHPCPTHAVGAKWGVDASEHITEDWLREVGFKWHQLDRQPEKQWLLWVGSLCGRNSTFEDLGIELAPSVDGTWFCWVRADTSSRYSRFLYVRHMTYRAEVMRLFEGLTGCPWNPSLHWGGSARTEKQMQWIHRDLQRLDQQLLREQPWRSIEKDDSQGGPLPEHLEAHEKDRGRA